MVIDKTTGRGCAWSIVSRTIARRLIAENIVGKPIYIKPHQSSYALLRVTKWGDRVRVRLQRCRGLPDDPIWTPSFIDAGIWGKAVARFSNSGSLETNLEKYLLPEMDEYLQNIPDAELVSMTRDFLLEQGVLNTPVCQRAGKTYYFSENEVYSLDKKSELFSYDQRRRFGLFGIAFETCFNMNVWRKAVSRFEVGMTLKECVRIFLKTELSRGAPQGQSPIDQLVQSIAPPIYGRVPGNSDEATFDHIHITVGLPRYQFDSWEVLKDEIEKYQQEIYQRVIQKLENDHQLKRYGVPVNFLKLSDVTLLRDFSIEFIFELKKKEEGEKG